jgi:hypothetical protein
LPDVAVVFIAYNEDMVIGYSSPICEKGELKSDGTFVPYFAGSDAGHIWICTTAKRGF